MPHGPESGIILREQDQLKELLDEMDDEEGGIVFTDIWEGLGQLSL